MAANQVGHPCCRQRGAELPCSLGPALKVQPGASASPRAHPVGPRAGLAGQLRCSAASSSQGAASPHTELPGASAGGSSCLACAAQALLSWGSSSAYTSPPEHPRCVVQGPAPCLHPLLVTPVPALRRCLCLVAVLGCLPMALAVVLVLAPALSSCLIPASAKGTAIPARLQAVEQFR